MLPSLPQPHNETAPPALSLRESLLPASSPVTVVVSYLIPTCDEICLWPPTVRAYMYVCLLAIALAAWAGARAAAATRASWSWNSVNEVCMVRGASEK